ncbi:MAG: toll/interleukin-1 receptor domain-containing protein [Anaerolineales bacterium]
MTSPSVFISYSHKDEEWKNRLETHLRVLEMQEILNVWEDRQIEAGDDWYPEIENAINNATIAILMISANFLTSKFIVGEEVPKLLERREKEGIRVIPVIVKPCTWTRVSWLSKIQARPKDGRALSAGSDHQIDLDLSAIAEEVARAIDKPKGMLKKDEERITVTLPKEGHVAEKIKRLIDFGDYEKAIKECESILDIHFGDPMASLLITVASLKGRGADRYQTSVIRRLEKYLSNACDDESYSPTALVVWGLIKHDHYQLNNLWQDKPSLDDLKETLAEKDLESIDFSIVEKIKASQSAYDFFGLSRFFVE